MIFKITNTWGDFPENAKSKVFLSWDNWNDFSYYTLFGIFYINEKSEKIQLGSIKIGFLGQKEGDRILSEGAEFRQIGPHFFSVGTDVEYYERLNDLGEEIRNSILIGLNDIAYNTELYKKAIQEKVTKISFLRDISEITITGQFRRLAYGGSKLTNYDFTFISSVDDKQENHYALSFSVEPYSNPPSNIHVLIGRNGVGKTYLIHNMIDALTKNRKSFSPGKFLWQEKFEDQERLFANLVCVTFSAFDEFEHPPEEKDKSVGLQYSYIGLKSVDDTNTDQQNGEYSLAKQFYASLFSCINNSKQDSWKKTILILESDPIFRSFNISQLIDNNYNERELKKRAIDLFQHLSSGHKIILLTVTRLVEKVQEKSLVLFDEPECHLHPPLLSSFTRAISDLLIEKNAVGIIATHSPVILQEVPKSCVWKLRRNGITTFAERLQIESFGENVGILTQEIFGLEVTDSGFHKILKDIVNKTNSYEHAIRILNNQLGLESKAILRSLFYQKEQSE
ncbi:AAA family ATPase [Chryseobacterium sp. SL1]|uniref:AAA family ATPase n=1 Tax=Chryseobacterium sp. SL1 TaxID=2995159 RepID=UPI00227706A5|nr:AAA family ATPase [Chryseobacterium sp. SL1]MCY1662315.1 AAA family ATPase [Chryseobacterium sp. SL1]